MLGAVSERAEESARAPVPTLVDAGPTAMSRSDRVLFGGLVALVVAATMSGLRTNVTIRGYELTIRPDQVVLLALLPSIAVALTRRGLTRWWSVLHIPVFAFLAANAVASVAASGVRDVSLQGTVLMTVYVLTSQLASFLWVGFPWIFMGLTTAAVVAMQAQHRNAAA
jgi:hypothetical protein